MDTDKNGKISKQEYMNFMSAEFDRLDKDKSGELDAKELAQSQLRPAAGLRWQISRHAKLAIVPRRGVNYGSFRFLLPC